MIHINYFCLEIKCTELYLNCDNVALKDHTESCRKLVKTKGKIEQ